MPTLAYKEEWASGPHDTNFYTRIYTSAHPKALLVFVHGAAEHAGRYTEMHTVLAREHDIAIFMFDQRGFGRTALDIDHKSADAGYGKTNRGYQMNDLEWAIEHARTKVQNVPVFLMGTSMVSGTNNGVCKYYSSDLRCFLSYLFVKKGGGEVLGLLCDRTRAENVAVKCLAGVVAGSPCIILTNPIPWPVMWVARRIADVRPYTQFPFRNNSGVCAKPLCYRSLCMHFTEFLFEGSFTKPRNQRCIRRRPTHPETRQS